MTAAIDPTAQPMRESITDENRWAWSEALGVPPEHVERFLFDLPSTGASDDDRNRE